MEAVDGTRCHSVGHWKLKLKMAFETDEYWTPFRVCSEKYQVVIQTFGDLEVLGHKCGHLGVVTVLVTSMAVVVAGILGCKLIWLVTPGTGCVEKLWPLVKEESAFTDV